ncbi:hypothetical protein LCGC14_2582040, partial [marine sediment metagenome]
DALLAAYFQDGGDGISTRMFTETVHRAADLIGDDLGFWAESDPHDHGYTVHTALQPTKLRTTYQYGGWLYPGRVEPPNPLPATWANRFTDEESATDEILDAFNEGVGLVVHRGHADASGWVTPRFRGSDLDELDNDDRLPVVLSINCDTGMFDTTDAFAETLMTSSEGGAIGVVAAVRTSYSGLNDALTVALLDGFWDEADADWTSAVYPSSFRPAEALNRAKARLLEGYGPDNTVAALTAQLYQWFGDPEMMLRTKMPSTLAVDHPRSFQLELGGDLMVVVSDSRAAVEGARVSISMVGTDDYWVGTTDSDGIARIADVTTSFPGNYDIVVTAQNAVPYEGIIASVSKDPYAELVDPVADSVTNEASGHVDVRWIDSSGTGIDGATVDTSDISITGVTVTSVTPQDDNVWRYAFDGDLTSGEVEVVFHSDQVADNEGKKNVGQLLHFVYDVVAPRGSLQSPSTLGVVSD